MARWSDVEAAAPDLAARAQRLFDARKHKTMATLRRDGSPRISGIEAEFRDGDVWLGMMPGSVKARDLRRDPRVALHSPTEDPPEENPSSWPGEAKLAGRAVEVDPREPPAERGHTFRVELDELVLTRVSGDALVVESWHEGRGVAVRERR